MPVRAHRRSCGAHPSAARRAGRPYGAGQNVCAICRPSRCPGPASGRFCAPSAQANTIRALSASACAVLRRLANDPSSDRSSSLSLRSANCRPAIASFIAVANILLAQRCESTENLMLRICESGHLVGASFDFAERCIWGNLTFIHKRPVPLLRTPISVHLRQCQVGDAVRVTLATVYSSLNL
jgi:hypothetical protein